MTFMRQQTYIPVKVLRRLFLNGLCRVFCWCGDLPSFSRHRGHRPPEPRSPRGERQAEPADGERLREPPAEHRARPRDRRLLRHPALRPPQRPIGGRDQPIGRGGLHRLRVSDAIDPPKRFHIFGIKIIEMSSYWQVLYVLDWCHMSSVLCMDEWF